MGLISHINKVLSGALNIGSKCGLRRYGVKYSSPVSDSFVSVSHTANFDASINTKYIFLQTSIVVSPPAFWADWFANYSLFWRNLNARLSCWLFEKFKSVRFSIKKKVIFDGLIIFYFANFPFIFFQKMEPKTCTLYQTVWHLFHL